MASAKKVVIVTGTGTARIGTETEIEIETVDVTEIPLLRLKGKRLKTRPPKIQRGAMDPSPAAAAVIGVTGVDVGRTVPSNLGVLFPKDPIIRGNLRPVLMANLMVGTLFRHKNNPQKRGPVTKTNVAVAIDTATVVAAGILGRDLLQKDPLQKGNPLLLRSQRQSPRHRLP
jgi:hypothetical protein